MSKLYVVCGCERLRDGCEEWAKVVGSLEAAAALLAKCGNGFAGSNMTFRVFELGKELRVEEDEEEQPQPPIRTKTYKVGNR